MPPFPSMKFFDTKIFLKHRRVVLWGFLVLWEKKYSTQNRDTPLLCMSFFDTPNFFTHWRVLHKVSRQSGTKYFRRNILLPFLFSINSFPYQKNSDTQKDSLQILSFRLFETEKFRQNRDAPLPEGKFFQPEIFWNTKGFPRKIVGMIGQKLLNRKQWYPLLMHQSFWCPNLSETPKCSLAMFFGTVRQKIDNTVLPSPPMCETFR